MKRSGPTPRSKAWQACAPCRKAAIITAGIASQNCDGAAAMLIASERAVKDHGLKPRARIHHISVRADDPVWMLTAPDPRHANMRSRRPA